MLKAKLLGATAGAEAALAIEDVFSTYLYTGNGTARTITNGIDLAGEGGLVWIKLRSTSTAFSFSHALFDTERGVLQYHRTNGTNASSNYNNSLTSFNSDGFSLGTDPSTGLVNYGTGTNTYASWAFRQAPRFFDVVTWTGTGANRTIAHDLGVVPGCIIVKRRDTTGDWQVYHRSLANTEYLVLNSTAAKATGATRWNSTTPTSSVFSLGTDATVNASGGTYVAYLFAHDPLGPSGDGSDGLIACGSYTGTGAAGNFQDLGWEPQYVLVKGASASGYNWHIHDVMRGMSESQSYTLKAESSEAENLDTPGRILPRPTGFEFSSSGLAANNASGVTYTYIAIRRGPMREPTVGTEVFNALTYVGNQTNGTTFSYANTPHIDLSLSLNRTNYFNIPEKYAFVDRLRGSRKTLNPQDLTSERNNGLAFKDNSSTNQVANDNTGNFNYNGHGFVSYAFTRAPGFFDVVAYTGTGANRTISHNLGVAPELMIVKKRSAVDNWIVYAGDATDYLILNSTAATADLDTMWNDTAPTGSVFSLGTNDDVNGNTDTFIAYLFASLSGISKVGSYTGNGSSQTINCGFTTGARFILIKRTDSTGDWYVWDTARGIVAGNDPRLSLNTTAAEVTTDDTIDPDNSGFIVNQVAATNVNVSSASYIFYAVS